jgi:flagellar motor switch protein FliG
MDGITRAAILLLGIGEDNAGNVLKHLEPKQVQKISEKMTSLQGVNSNQIQKVIDDFIAMAEKQTSFGVNSEGYIKKMLITAFGEDKAGNIIDRVLTSKDDHGLGALKWLDSKSVADLIRNEHPQTMATVLTYLDSEQAAEVVGYFPADKQVDLLMRMATTQALKPDALTELGRVLEDQLAGQRRRKSAAMGGVKSVADVINYLDNQTETMVLEGIREADEELCDEIQDQMFVFDNLLDMDNRSIQTLLRECSQDKLLIALRGGEETIREKIFGNMSKRAADLMRDDLEALGPVKVSDVEASQREILNTAKRLADSGEITLGAKGQEELI